MKKISYVLIISGAVIWGCTGIFVNTMRSFGFTTMELVFLRAVIAAVCLCGSALIFNRQLFKVRFKDIWIFIGTGLVSYLFFTFCYFTAMEMCSLSVAAVLLYTSPVFVVVMGALFLKEGFNRYKLISVFMTFVGCALVVGIVGSDIKLNPMGIIIGLGGGFWYALYTIFGRVGLMKYNTLTVTMYTFIVGSISSALFVDFGGFAAKINSPDILMWTLTTGVVTCVIPYLLYTAGLAGVEAGRAAVMSTVEPVVASIVGVVFYNEGMDFFKILGIVLVIGSIVIINKGQRIRC